MFSPLIDELINALRTLPSVGPKSAQRMAFQLLQHNRDGGERLAKAINAALSGVGRCEQCRTLSEQSPCRLCTSPHRDTEVVCVVEAPTDIMAFEQSGSFNGQYFVLHGHLSPLDGVGPDDIGLPELAKRLESGQVRELIIATNPTIEGEATAQVLAEMGQAQGVTVSRLAQGVPLGGELEFLDGGTLAHALNSRQPIAS